MAEALTTNVVLLALVMAALWRVAVRIGDVSFIDAVWGAGMAMLGAASWWQVTEPGSRAGLIAGMALLWGLRALWARVTGRSVTPWAMPIDPRTGWTTVVRRSEHWMGSGRSAAPGTDTPAHLRPLPGAEDITDRVVDVEARIASARTLEQRLLAIATERTSTVESLLAVERELARVRGDLEQLEGRRRQWADQVALSTLTLHLTTRAPVTSSRAEPGFGARTAGTLRDSLVELREFGAGLLILLVALAPWAAFAVPAAFGVRALLRRRRARLPAARTVVTPAA